MKNNVFTRNLPLLDQQRDLFSNINLKNVLLISIQHLCSTTYNLFVRLFELGLEPGNLFVLGKCYSTNPDIFYKLKQDGVNVLEESLYFDSHVSYDEFIDRATDNLIKSVQTSRDFSTFEKVILLDDGGYLLNKFNCQSFKLNKNNVVGVEQTSHGFNKLKNSVLKIPIINAARSWIKLRYESPLIGELLKWKLVKNLQDLLCHGKNALIIGFGPIGQSAYNVLSTNFDVDVFDIKKNISNLIDFNLKARLDKYDIIIGCTGNTVLRLEDLKFLKRPVILASVSSSDIEFDAVNIRKMVPKYYNCHRNIHVDGINLLNSGFPITFDNDFEGIDTDDYQLTRSILLASICQAFSNNGSEVGFIDLDNGYQNNILDGWIKIKSNI